MQTGKIPDAFQKKNRGPGRTLATRHPPAARLLVEQAQRAGKGHKN
jgi:hypothetical protein